MTKRKNFGKGLQEPPATRRKPYVPPVTLTLRQQLNRYLFQSERSIVNGAIRQLPTKEDRDLVRLALVTYAKYRNKAMFFTEDPLLNSVINGLRPFVKLSLMKGADTNYCVACPEDNPIENDRD